MTDAARPAGLLINGIEFIPQDIVEQHTPFLTPPGAQVEVLYRLHAGYHVVRLEDLPKIRRYPNPEEGPEWVVTEGQAVVNGKVLRVDHTLEQYERIATPEEVDDGCELGIAYDPLYRLIPTEEDSDD